MTQQNAVTKPQPRLHLAEWLGLWALLLALGGYIAYSEYLNYQQIDSSERVHLTSQAKVVERTLAAQLHADDQALQGLRRELARRRSNGAGAHTMDKHLKELSKTLTGISAIFVTNASGQIIHTSVASLVGYDVSGQGFFRQALKQHSPATLFVVPPFAIATGEVPISLVREVSNARGEFDGVVLAALDPVFYGVLLESIRFTPDTTTVLAHGDGKILVAAPVDATQLGKDLAVPSSFFTQHKTSGRAASIFNGVTYQTGDVRIVAYQTVQPPELAMDKPLMVAVMRVPAAIHAGWLGRATRMAWLYAGLCAMVCTALFLHQRRRRVLQRLDRAKESDLQYTQALLVDTERIGRVGGWEIDVQTRQTTWTQGVYDIYELDTNVRLTVDQDISYYTPASQPVIEQAVQRAIEQGEPFDLELEIISAKGNRRSVHTVGVADRARGKVSGFFQDITERKTAEQKINSLAFYDQLTGLPNRILLADRLKQTITASNRNSTIGALLFIDLDHFKTLNDTQGHDMGDLQLKQVATRLSTCVREGDTVARVGGDEFVVILAGLSEIEIDAATDTEAVAVKILAALSQPYQMDHVTHRSSASIGATLFRGTGTNIDDLMKQSDIAMYRAKDAGRNAVRFFDPSMEMAVVQRAALEKDLRNALAQKQFVLHYQAQVEGAGGVNGAEALVRWHHPQRGLVSPAEFIPLAEETGVILALGHWVLATACSQLEKWAHVPSMAHLTLAVNVSAVQFAQNDFVEQVMSAVQRAGINPQRLKLELTEGLLVANVDDTIVKMKSLKASGIGFSLDDFGTGYSSLAYLSRLPLDQLKIDKSFVNNLVTSPVDAAIATTIIALAQSLHLGVIAEGVETDAQREFLANAGCHACQGYLLSRPLPLEGFEAFVRGTSLPTTAPAVT